MTGDTIAQFSTGQKFVFEVCWLPFFGGVTGAAFVGCIFMIPIIGQLMTTDTLFQFSLGQVFMLKGCGFPFAGEMAIHAYIPRAFMQFVGG